MRSLRQAIRNSWFPEMTVVSADLAPALPLPLPLSLTAFTRFFDQPEVLFFEQPVDADALHGRVEVTLRSDGTYTFRGHMRATGFPSFSYTLQVFVRAAGVIIALETRGRVFGTDTPGDRQKNWEESGSYADIRRFWPALRLHATLEVLQDSELAGVTGTLADIGQAALETYLAAQTGGTVGALIVLGANVGSATGVTVRNPNVLMGITVGAGVFFAFGPGFILPAVAAGTGVAALANIRHRTLTDEEIRRADEVFRGTLPVHRIVLTDLHSPDRERAFVYPAIDGSIQVNLGRNFDDPLGPDVRGRGPYLKPGSLLMHELTHAWQIEHATFLPGFICEALTDREYAQNVKSAGSGASWSADFGPEQQGSIVDSWYSDHLDTGLASPAALADPRFRYIAENIRRGVD